MRSHFCLAAILSVLACSAEATDHHWNSGSAAWATKSVASGLYFARFRAPGFEAVQRFVVMR